ncbi:aminotransferase class I/II-fold pyridoxal phosphate-dependent enzyme [Nocardiopsis dassonvillei]|uniref:aminotransferase class I/II-fold pyridoxal phosphate-dependent enzyme n=1 Tax=Nocardiopsis dassonvillei TaxID=2014 RepID=UPI00366C6ADB
MTEATGPPAGTRFSDPPVPGVDLTESDLDADTRFKERVVRVLVEEPWNRYPERIPVNASEHLADALGVAPGRLSLTSGCTEALRCAFLHAHHRGMALHVPVPSYPGYARVLRTFGADHHTYDARTAPSELVRHVSTLPDRSARAVVLGSPGNPVGPLWTVPELDRLADTSIGLVILDLTYALFHPGAEAFLRYEHPNVVQCLSLSKSHSLAGVRIGAMAADPEVLGQLRRLQPDFPLDLFQLGVCHAIGESSFLAESQDRAHRVLGITGAIAGVLEQTDGITVVSDQNTNFVTASMDGVWWDVLAGVVREGGLRAKVFERNRLIRFTSTAHNLELLSSLLQSRVRGRLPGGLP